jgi:hypothetical protein
VPNATRIRRIAFAVICGEVGRAAIVFVMNYYASTHFAADGLSLPKSSGPAPASTKISR